MSIMDQNKTVLDIKMIEEVKNNECLYNVMCPKYKAFEYKERVWAKIGKETGRTGIETKKRWKSIRDGYKRFQQKTTINGFYKPYKYAEYMRFLDNITTRRESKAIQLPSLDIEVSTELSSEDEVKYENLEKRIKYDIENTYDDTQEPFGTSATFEYTKTELLNFDINTNIAIERTIEDETTPHTNKDTEERTISFKEKQVEGTYWIERFIEDIKSYDCIYNRQSDRYKDYEYKKRLWHKIGKRFGLKGRQAIRKWKNLRDSYRRYKLKRKADGFVKYKYAVSLKFLEDYIIIEPSDSLNLSDAEVSTELSSDDEFLCELPEKAQLNFGNSFEDIKESWKALSTDDNSKTDCSNPETSTGRIIEPNEENNKVTWINADTAECYVSSDNEDPSKKNQLNERIIREVKKHDCIFNKQFHLYRNRSYKKRVWYKIAKRVGLRETEVRSKWKSLRDGYRKYKLKSLNETCIGMCKHKNADSLKFLDDYMDISKTKKRDTIKLPPSSEISTDLSNDCYCSTTLEFPVSQSAKDHNPIANEVISESPSPFIITSRLFQLLVNKIYEADLTVQQKNDIEYAVSAVVYSKLAEYSKSGT